MLAILDTYAKAAGRTTSLPFETLSKTSFALMKSLYSVLLLLKHPGRKIHYEMHLLKLKLYNSLGRKKLLRRNGNTGFFSNIKKNEEKNKEAIYKYVYKANAGSIDLFRVTKHTFYVDDFEYLGMEATCCFYFSTRYTCRAQQNV